MDASEELAREHAEWVDRAEETVLRYDALMFPGENHKIFRVVGAKDMRGAITYQDEHQAYFFNQLSYLESLQNIMERDDVPSDRVLLEVDRVGVILSAAAVRMRAYELYRPPLRSLSEVIHDDRVPWKVKRIMQKHPTIRRYDANAKNDLRSLYDGCHYAVALDIAVVGMLANHAFRNDLSPEWLRPFVLT